MAKDSATTATIDEAPAQTQARAARTAPPLPPQLDTAEQRGEISIEIVTRVAGSLVVCDPMRGLGIEPPTLRGRWSRDRMPTGLTAGETGLDNLPAVPGQCISIHLGRKYVRIWDPLGMPQNRERMRLFNQVWTQSPYSQGLAFAPVPDRVVNLVRHTAEATADNIATWLYWMQRALGMWNRRQCWAELVPNSANPSVALGGDPTINFDASAAPGDPRTLSQMIHRFEFLSKQGTVRTVVD
jgi:hypothetical protein